MRNAASGARPGGDQSRTKSPYPGIPGSSNNDPTRKLLAEHALEFFVSGKRGELGPLRTRVGRRAATGESGRGQFVEAPDDGL